MPLIDGSIHLRKGRGEERETGIPPLGQKIGTGADIAPGGGIEGGAVFVEDLAHAPLLQRRLRPGEGADRADSRDDTGLEAEDHRLQTVQSALPPRPQQDRAANPAPSDQRGQFQRPGQVIGDGPENEATAPPPLCALTARGVGYMIYPFFGIRGNRKPRSETGRMP